MENRLENVEKIMKEYNHFIEEQEPKLSKEMLDDIENKKKELGGNTRHLNRLKEELENLDTKNMGYVEMHAIMGEYKRQINEAQENVDKLKSEYDELLVKKEKMENPNKTYEEEQEDKTDRMNARGKAKKELTIELKEIDCDIEEKKIELQSKEFERKKFKLKYEEQEQSFEARDENGNLVTLTKKVKVPQNAEEYKKISEDISKIYGELEELAKAKSKCEEYIAQIDEEFKKEVEEINDILKRNTKKETSKDPSSLGGEDKEQNNSTEDKSEPKQTTNKNTNKTKDESKIQSDDDSKNKSQEQDKQTSTEPKEDEFNLDDFIKQYGGERNSNTTVNPVEPPRPSISNKKEDIVIPPVKPNKQEDKTKQEEDLGQKENKEQQKQSESEETPEKIEKNKELEDIHPVEKAKKENVFKRMFQKIFKRTATYQMWKKDIQNWKSEDFEGALRTPEDIQKDINESSLITKRQKKKLNELISSKYSAEIEEERRKGNKEEKNNKKLEDDKENKLSNEAIQNINDMIAEKYMKEKAEKIKREMESTIIPTSINPLNHNKTNYFEPNKEEIKNAVEKNTRQQQENAMWEEYENKQEDKKRQEEKLAWKEHEKQQKKDEKQQKTYERKQARKEKKEIKNWLKDEEPKIEEIKNTAEKNKQNKVVWTDGVPNKKELIAEINKSAEERRNQQTTKDNSGRKSAEASKSSDAEIDNILKELKSNSFRNKLSDSEYTEKTNAVSKKHNQAPDLDAVDIPSQTVDMPKKAEGPSIDD